MNKSFSLAAYLAALIIAMMTISPGEFGNPHPQSGAAHAAEKFESVFADVHEYRIENGLTLLVLPRRELPILSLQIWYKTGSAHEVPGETGIAHFLEHMYSLGTKSYGPRDVDRLVRSVGGQKNASTWVDYTRYFVNIPSAALDDFLDIEAERIRDCTFPSDKVESEKGTVAEERRMRNEDDPGGMAYQRLMEMVFDGHPYAHPTVGYMDDIQGYDREMLIRFYDMYYHPDNATIVIAGDVEPQDAYEKVKAKFGRLPVPARPFRQPVKFESRQSEEKRDLLYHPSPSPLIYIAWPGVAMGDGDAAALDVLSEVLTGGRSGRLYLRLVRRENIATGVSSSNSERRFGGAFTIRADFADADLQDKIESAIYEEIELIVSGGVQKSELENAKKRILAGEVYGAQSNGGLASAIGWTETVGGWRYLIRFPEQIEKVSADDVRAAAAKHLKSSARSVVAVHPESAREGGENG